MKTKLSIVIGLLFVAALIIPVSAASPFQISGSHYQLNIIGAKNYDETLGKPVGDSMGHTLFVRLDGKSKIIMTQARDGVFQVVDRNGIDADGAKFNIAPGYYNVYARAKGTPGGKVNITAWGEFEDALDGSTIINLGYVNLARDSGKPVSVNINKLFYVNVTLCTGAEADTCIETTTYTNYWVFAIDELMEYWWDYDNDGLKNLEVRFYECTYDETGTAEDYCRWANGAPIVSSKTVVT
jgi:uncharacterized lipoprotein NlpE involved in copper resistance